MLAPFNLQKWVKENTDKFTPPIGNHQLYKEQWENLLIMVIGGENYRPDYHDDPGEELFYQITGDLTLKIIDPHIFATLLNVQRVRLVWLLNDLDNQVKLMPLSGMMMMAC